MGRLRTFKAAGAEMTFAERIDEAMRETGKLTQALVDQVANERRAYLSRLAAIDPRKAIRDSWDIVREGAQDVARRRGMTWSTTKHFAEKLGGEGVLSSMMVELILDLRNLRYDMADQEQQEVTATTAAAYVAAATNLADALRSLSQS
jgi:hypothetical protein